MPSLSLRTAYIAIAISLAGLAGCSQPSGTAILDFGEHAPLSHGMRDFPQSLRDSIPERLHEFGTVRIESMAPKEIPHPEGDVTFITHRYRVRVVFLDEPDAGQRIRETFDALQAARQNWSDGFPMVMPPSPGQRPGQSGVSQALSLRHRIQSRRLSAPLHGPSEFRAAVNGR